jgi:hypothetical protein
MLCLVTTVVGAARNMHDIPDQSRALVSCSRQTWNLVMVVCDGLLQEDGPSVGKENYVESGSLLSALVDL